MGKISINQDSLKERREWKRHKVDEGSNVFRILPPFGDPEVHNGYPYRKWSYIWLNDPSNGKLKPFASPYSTGGDSCPVKEYADALAKKVESIISELKEDGLSDDQIKKNARLAGIREVQWKLKLSHGYLYNACDKSGDVGILELKATAHKAMMKRMNEYIKTYGEDPTSLNSFGDDSGVWFDIRRDGKGKETEYSVSFNQTTEKDEKGRLAKFDDRSPLPENVSQNYEDLGYDLSAMYTVKSYDELKDILTANIVALATADKNPIPDLIIEGFGDEGIQTEEVLEEAPVQRRAAPQQQATVAKKKPPVTLKVDDEDESDDEEAVSVISTASLKKAAPAAAPKATARPASTPDNDFFAMADDLLKD